MQTNQTQTCPAGETVEPGEPGAQVEPLPPVIGRDAAGRRTAHDAGPVLPAQAGRVAVRALSPSVTCWSVEASVRPRTGAFLVGGGSNRRVKEHHISEPRINDRIRVPEVRLVGPNGEQ